MRLSLFHADVLVTTLEADLSEKVISGDLSLLPGSAMLEEAVHDGWRAISNYGFLPPPGQFVGGVNEVGDRAGRAAIARFNALEAELCSRAASIVRRCVNASDCSIMLEHDSTPRLRHPHCHIGDLDHGPLFQRLPAT